MRFAELLVVTTFLVGCNESDDGGGATTGDGSGTMSGMTSDPSSADGPPTGIDDDDDGVDDVDATGDPVTSGGTDDTTGDPPATGLGIDGEQFTWNGTPTFLVGVSYFDARYWRESDLDGLAQRGWNLVRVWLDWGETGLFGRDGALTDEGAQILLALVDAAAAREIVVDVTILDPTLVFTPDTDHRIAAVQSVATTLADRTNVLYDVMNEHDHGAGPIDHAEGAAIVAALRAVDPEAIVTISSTGGHLVEADASVQTRNVDGELDEVAVAVITPHLPRTPDWADATDTRVTALRDYLQSRGTTIPIYLQEEARRGHSGLDPSEGEFIQAATEARDAGAAAWILHTDAGFDLAALSFFDAIDEVEAIVVDMLPGSL